MPKELLQGKIREVVLAELLYLKCCLIPVPDPIKTRQLDAMATKATNVKLEGFIIFMTQYKSSLTKESLTKDIIFYDHHRIFEDNKTCLHPLLMLKPSPFKPNMGFPVFFSRLALRSAGSQEINNRIFGRRWTSDLRPRSTQSTLTTLRLATYI